MRVIRREFNNCTRKSIFRIIPLGDIHIGSSACDEQAFKSTIQEIKKDPNCYWIGMGDYCDFINMRDPRFSAGLAPWIGVSDLTDLARCQVEYFNGLIKPIARKCLGLIEGNHETSIKRHSERDVFSSIVTATKTNGGFKSSDKLGFGISGWLKLMFRRVGNSTSAITFYLHHGFVGGRLAGAKALNMQRVLWTRDCDVVLMGHSHNQMIQVETIHGVTQKDAFVERKRYGAYTGSFLRSTVENETTYAEAKGYYPQAVGQVEARLKPHDKKMQNRIRLFPRG